MTALLVSHPGHELRIHHWMELTRPVVFVITDGSGHTGTSRLATTTAVLERVGATPGSVYGRMSDREIYAAMMRGDQRLFTDLARELSDAFVRLGVREIACDAAEGYNPSHDVCRYIAEAAATLTSASGGTLPGYDFPLVAAPTACPPHLRDRAWTVQLDEGALDRKIAAARGYEEIAGDVDRTLAAYGRAAFLVESLRPFEPMGLEPPGNDPPFYEQHGERQVAAGHYTQVLRFRDHVRPVAAALRALTTVVTP
jgi:hypothetical protein